MNKRLASQIAETITDQQLQQMLDNAQRGITDWTQRSNVNKTITKGVAWNILGKSGIPAAQSSRPNMSHLVKTNMVWEFGDFLPDGVLPEKKEPAPEPPAPFHQEPEFDDSDLMAWLDEPGAASCDSDRSENPAGRKAEEL